MLSPLLLFAMAAMASATSNCTLSNVFGDHMVLQRAPTAATVWGFAPTGTIVKTTTGGRTMTATADASGVWRQPLIPTMPTTTGNTISFVCSTGESFALQDVLFGDVSIVLAFFGWNSETIARVAAAAPV